jgi:hypothetical protein
MTTPVLLEPVIRLGEIGGTFCIGGRSAWVESEFELHVKLVEEGSRRGPFVGTA